MRPESGILIASVSVGAGHVRCAEAVQAALAAADPSRPVEHVDALDLAPAWVRRFYREAFLRLAERSRSVAQRLYLGTDGDRPDNVRWGHLAERAAFRRLRRFLTAGHWEHCICTHFLPCQLAYPGIRPTLHLVVTDFALHRFWVQPEVDDFFVATERMAATLRRRVPRARAHATGIPIVPRFAESFDRRALRRELGLDPRAPVVLAMGGGWGVGVTEMVQGALAAAVPGLTVLAVCGANEHAYRDLLASPCERVRAFAFVADVAPLVAAADLVLSKPGGVTTSEALAVGRPLLLTRGIPGNEDRNARALVDMGAARFADSGTLTRQIERFFKDRLLAARWTRASELAGSPGAAQRIAAHFVRDVEPSAAMAGAASVSRTGERPGAGRYPGR